MLKTNLKTETAKDRLTRMALSNSGAGASPSVPAPAVMPQTASSGNTAKERLAKLAAQNSASGVYSMERPTVNIPKVNTPAVTATKAETPQTTAPKTEATKQTTVAPKDATFWEKLGLYLSGSTDTTLPNVQANDSSELIAENLASGAVESAKGAVNLLNYYGQGAMRGKLASAEAQQKADAAITGSKGSAALADNFKSTLDAQEAKGLTAAVDWGNGLKQDITERSQTADKATLKIGEVAGTVGGMLPSIAANAILPGSGLLVMGEGAAGNAIEQAKAEGASDAGALTYGTAVGAIEAATEKMLDGVFGVFGKGVADDAVEKLVTKYVKSGTAQNAILTLTSMLGEGAEEFVAEVTENWMNRLTAKTDDRRGLDLLSDAGKSAAMGALVSSLFQGAQVMKRGDNITAAQVADNAVAAIDGGGAAQNTQNPVQAPVIAQEVTQAKPSTYTASAPESNTAQQGVAGEKAQPPQSNGIFPPDSLGAKLTSELPSGVGAAENAVVETTPVEQKVPQNAEKTLEQHVDEFNSRNDEYTRRLEAAQANDNITDEEYTWLSNESESLSLEYQNLIRDIRVSKGEVSKNYNSAENHIDNRTMDGVAKRSIKAFQFDHPELHQYFVDAAKALGAEAGGAVDVDRYTTNYKRGSVKAARNALSKKYRGVIIDAISLGLSKPEIMKCCEDIIEDNGQENYAAAKRIEIILDKMLSDGYTTGLGENVSPNNQYISAKGTISGSETIAERRVRQARENYKLLDAIEGEPSPDELLAREKEYADIRSKYSADQESQNKSELPEGTGAASNSFVPEQKTSKVFTNTYQKTDSLTDEQRAQIDPKDYAAAPEENKGNDDGIGAKTAKFGYDEVETQTHSSDGLYTETERTQDGIKAEDRTHKVNHDAEVDEAAAQRYEFDYKGEKADLFGTKQDWDDADTVLAHKILANEVEKARKSGSAEAWKEVARLQKVWDAQGTTAGQAFRQRGRFANTPDAMVAEAANVIYGEDADTKLRRLSPQRKAGIMETVKDMADRYNAIEAGDTASLVSLIKRLNEIRKTTGLFSNKTSKQMEWALDWYAKNGAGGETLLRDVAAAQIRNIAGDYARLSPVEAAKNYRIAGMLSKVSTIMRNLISNNVIDPLDSLSNNLAVPLDSLLSKYTKTRSVAVDKSWASKAKRAGSLDGAVRSFIQVGLDADVTDSASKYEQRSGRVFKMTGNPIERLLSTWSKMEGYALQTTDEFQKGGIKAETQRGLNELSKSGAVGADYAGTRSTEIAKQRTFQNDGALSNMMIKGRDALNSLKITDKQGGTMGAGDVLLPFAKVPANVTAMLGNYSPLGLAKGMLDMGKVIEQAKSGTLTSEMQAKAVTEIGRGMTGSAALAGFVALAIKGILNVGGSDDKDEDALQKSSGVTGTQMNLSALERWIAGKSTEWQDGDKLISVGFLEPLNGLMAAASAIADSYAEDHEVSLGDIANASVEAVFQSVIDLPAMSSISNLINSYKYSKADTTSGKIGDALGGYAAGQASSFLVPNFVGGMASGFDNTVRDAYSGETGFQQAVDGIKLKIPGLRQTLPAKLDNFGNPRTYTGNTGLNFLNSNIFPGQIANYKTNAVVNELTRLDGTGIGATFPDRAAPNSISPGAGKEKMALTADEKYRYQQTYGQTAYKQLSALFKSAEYKAMSDEEKAEAVSDVYSAATVEAKRRIVEGRGEMYLPTDGDVKKVDGYKAAGLSEDKAYSLYKAMDALVPETGKSEVSSQQKAKVVVQQGYGPKQTAALVGSLWNQSGAEEKKTLLPSLNVAQRLVTMYVSGGDSKLVSMTVPRSFSENNVAYTLTDAEMELFQTTYADYFNRNANNVMSEENLLRLREDAYNRAKYAVLRDRK